MAEDKSEPEVVYNPFAGVEVFITLVRAIKSLRPKGAALIGPALALLAARYCRFHKVFGTEEEYLAKCRDYWHEDKIFDEKEVLGCSDS